MSEYWSYDIGSIRIFKGCETGPEAIFLPSRFEDENIENLLKPVSDNQKLW
jgi:hypothetical protein